MHGRRLMDLTDGRLTLTETNLFRPGVDSARCALAVIERHVVLHRPRSGKPVAIRPRHVFALASSPESAAVVALDG